MTNLPLFDLFILFVIKSTVILLIVFAITKLMKDASASTQYVIKSFGLIAILMIPVYNIAFPSWDVALIENVRTVEIAEPISELTEPQEMNEAKEANEKLPQTAKFY